MIHGIINIYKEKGYTSHDVVAKLRGIVGQKKIGHTGTLDPDAQGVLPVCLGKGTKLCDLLTDKDKTYEAVMLLGVTTDSQDTSGTILEEKCTDSLEEDAVRHAIMSFVGEYDQVPPMFSALKVNGKKLYELAREGIEVERKARRVQIHEIKILDVNLPRVRMEVSCSKGTYIRTLCHDIGKMLGTGGCMEELLRTKVDRFEMKDSIRLDEVRMHRENGTLMDYIIAVDEMFPKYKKLYLTSEAANAVRHGNIFRAKDILSMSVEAGFENGEQVLVYDETKQFIAIYEYKSKERLFKIVKMFFDGNEK